MRGLDQPSKLWAFLRHHRFIDLGIILSSKSVDDASVVLTAGIQGVLNTTVWEQYITPSNAAACRFAGHCRTQNARGWCNHQIAED